MVVFTTLYVVSHKQYSKSEGNSIVLLLCVCVCALTKRLLFITPFIQQNFHVQFQNLIEFNRTIIWNKSICLSYHRTRYRIIQSLQQLNASWLSTSALSNQSNSLSWLNEKIETLQHFHIRSCWIEEFDIWILDAGSWFCLLLE